MFGLSPLQRSGEGGRYRVCYAPGCTRCYNNITPSGLGSGPRLLRGPERYS